MLVNPDQPALEYARATLSDRLLRESTVTSYLQTLHMLDMEQVPMSQVTLGFLHGRLQTVLNINTRRKHIVALRSMFRDVIPKIKELKIPKATPRVYELPDEETLRFTLTFCPYEVYGLLMMYAGLRAGEACAVSPGDVKGNLLTVQRQRDETGKLTLAKTQGQVVIPEWLADRIKVMEPQIVTPGALRESFRRYGIKTGIHLSPHMLRHWYATVMVNGRISPEIARRQMRHSDLKTTLGYYAQVQKQDIDQVVMELFSAKTKDTPPPSCVVCGKGPDDQPLKPLMSAQGERLYLCDQCLSR